MYKKLTSTLKLVHQLPLKIKVIVKIKNWYVFLVDYFNFSRFGDYFLFLNKKGILKLRFGTTDKWSVDEIILRDEYRISELPQGESTIVDLGANAGVFSIYASLQRPAAKIFSFEPEESNFSYLKSNVEINKLKNVQIFKLACSSGNGTRELYKGTDNRSYTLNKKQGQEAVVVKTLTLKQIFIKNHIKHCDLLKMDIEGSEYEVLYSTPRPLFNKIRKIILEYHNGHKKFDSGIELQKYLENIGFSVKREDSGDGWVGMIYATRSMYVK